MTSIGNSTPRAAVVASTDWEFSPDSNEIRLWKIVDNVWVPPETGNISDIGDIPTEHDLCALIPVTSIHRGMSTGKLIACDRGQFAELVEVFQIPLKAVECMFRSERGYYSTTETITSGYGMGGKIECTQYIMEAGTDRHTDFGLGPVQVVRTMNKASHRFRMLILCSHDMFRRIGNVLPKVSERHYATGQRAARSLYLELELFDMMLDSWRLFRRFLHVNAVVTVSPSRINCVIFEALTVPSSASKDLTNFPG